MAVAVEAAVELIQRRPVVAREIDVRGEHRRGFAAVRAEPRELGGRTDLVNAVGVLRRLGLRRAVPGVFARREERRGRDGEDAVFDLLRIGAAEREGAARDNIAVLGKNIGVIAVAERVAVVLIGLDGLAVRAGQRDLDALDRIAGGIGNDELRIVGHLAVHGDGCVRVVADVVVDVHGVEVRADAGIRHAVDRLKRAGRGEHGAEGIAVGEAVRCRLRALGELDVFRDGHGDGGVVHLLVLEQRAFKLRFTGVVRRLEVRRVEYAGDLVHAAEHAAERELDLIAGHDVFLRVGDILSGDGDLRHAHEAVAHAGIVGHLDDDRAAHAAAKIIKRLERHRIASVLARADGGEAGADAGHGAVRSDESVLDGHIARRGDGKVERRVGLVCFIEPGVVVVVPIHGAARRDVRGHVEVHVRVRGAVGHTRAADDDDADALRLRRGVETAVAAGGNAAGRYGNNAFDYRILSVIRADVHAVVVNGDDGVFRAGGDVCPVRSGVAAVHGRDRSIAGHKVPVEVRLDHDVGGIGVDELPVAVSAHARRAGNGLIAGGIEIQLQVGLVAVDRCGAELGEAVGNAVRRRVLAEGEARVRALAQAREPAGLCDVGIVAQTPRVVAVALGNLVFRALRAVAVVPPGGVLNFGGVEVVPLKVQAKRRVLRHRGRQGELRVDREVLISGGVTGTERLVDAL